MLTRSTKKSVVVVSFLFLSFPVLLLMWIELKSFYQCVRLVPEPVDMLNSSRGPDFFDLKFERAAGGDFADIEETLLREGRKTKVITDWISGTPDGPVDDLVMWKECIAWRKVVSGSNHGICAAEMDNHRWLQVGGHQDDCAPGYGRGICKLFNDSQSYYHAKMYARVLEKKNRTRLLDLLAMNNILAGRLKQIHSEFRELEGKVVLVNELPFTATHLFDKLELCPDFENTQHSAELWIPFLLQQHQYTSLLLNINQTSNEENLYYLSVFPQLHTQCHGDGGQELFHLGHEHIKEGIRQVINSTLWRDSHHGYNLFVPATHPLSPLGNFDLVGRPSFLTVDYEGSGRYPRDIIVPYVADQRNLPQSSFDRRTRLILMVSSWFNPKQTVRRSIEVAYAQYLNDQDVYYNTEPITEAAYVDLLLTSKFCFVARGDTTSSRRFVSVINAGCIPVVVGDWNYLPFQELIAYNEFCVFAGEAEVIEEPLRFLERLRGISADRIHEMQMNVVQAQFLLNYDSSFFLNPVTLFFIDASLRRRCYHHDNGSHRSSNCDVFYNPHGLRNHN